MILDNKRRASVHREIETLRSAYTKYRLGLKGGFQHHPEFLRFRDHPGQLITVHEEIASLLKRHNTPWKWGYTMDYKLPTQHFVEIKFDIPPEPYIYSYEDMYRDYVKLIKKWKKDLNKKRKR